MLDKKASDKIQELVSKLTHFAEEGKLKSRFDRFIQEEVEEQINSKEKYFEVLYAFVFDHKVDGKRTPVEVFSNEAEDLSEEDKEILSGWKTSVHSIFQVNKVFKDSFSVYNLVNEKDYTIKTLDKFINYKRVGANNYIFCRILPFEDYHILLGNLITFPVAARKEVLEMATMVQIESPLEMFKDNREKLEQIYEQNSIKFQKFYDFFGSSEVFTEGKHLNDIMTAFNAYYEFGEKEKDRVENKVNKTEKFYFDSRIVEKLQEDRNIHLHISDYVDCHDVGIVIDEKDGLSILPYYGTFKEIFSNKDFKNIPGYKECVMFYLEEETISPLPFVKVVTSTPVNCVNVFEDVLDQPGFSIQDDFDELMANYKYEYLFNNKLAPTVVYDNSLAFKELLAIYEDLASDIVNFPTDFKKVGRNDPCPCNSGKKFKKCCIDKFDI